MRLAAAVFAALVVWAGPAPVETAEVAQDATAPTPGLQGDGTQAFRDGLAAFEAGQAQRAYDIWSTAAEDGDALAQYGLGKLYETGGPGIPSDPEQAAVWYERAAESGVPAALNNLARLFADGRGVERDTDRAVLLWAQAAQLGHPHAQYNLGLALFRGEWIEQDQPGAVDWFLQAAAAGLPEAQFAAGQIFERGINRPADAARALEWYRRAARQGHAAAGQSAQRLSANLDAPASPEPAAPLPPSAQRAERPEPRPVAPQAAAEPMQRPDAPAAETSEPSPEPAPQAPAQTQETAPPPVSEPAPSAPGSETAAPAMAAQQTEPAPAVPQVAARPERPEPLRAGAWRLWLGSAADRTEGAALAERLTESADALDARDIELVPSAGRLRLLAGGYDSREAAQRVCAQLRSAAPTTFCIPLEE